MRHLLPTTKTPIVDAAQRPVQAKETTQFWPLYLVLYYLGCLVRVGAYSCTTDYPNCCKDVFEQL